MTEEKLAIFTFLNTNVSMITLLAFIVILFWLIDVIGIASRLWDGKRSLYEKIAHYALPLGFAATLISTAISLFYSDYLGVLPCGLCWFQRVFIYSMMFILGYAWWKKDSKVWGYIQTLSIPGLIIALYHEYLQLGYSELLPCPAIASTVDCAKPTFLEFGFVTYPFMSVVLFTALLLLAYVSGKYKK